MVYGRNKRETEVDKAAVPHESYDHKQWYDSDLGILSFNVLPKCNKW